LIVLAACSASAETISGRVVGVTDGDTITVLDGDKTQHKIRCGHRNNPSASVRRHQCPPWLAKTSKWCWQVRPLRTHVSARCWWPTQAAIEYVPKTLDAGHALITMGLAWWYRKYAREQSAEDANLYELPSKEAQARAWDCGAMRIQHPLGIGDTHPGR
jgi:hypothetical protein